VSVKNFYPTDELIDGVERGNHSLAACWRDVVCMCEIACAFGASSKKSRGLRPRTRARKGARLRRAQTRLRRAPQALDIIDPKNPARQLASWIFLLEYTLAAAVLL
jgi:hypothetical protein